MLLTDAVDFILKISVSDVDDLNGMQIVVTKHKLKYTHKFI